jgi:hypothetical protein
VRAWTRTLLWIGVLVACAAAGVVVAIVNPDLLVRDVPHADPPPPTSSPEPDAPTRRTLRLEGRSTHTYRVGGSCTSDWRMRARITVTSSGGVRGSGVARLRPGAGCDFPSAQVQAEAVRLRIVGRRAADGLRLRFREIEIEPDGARDLGGFIDIVTRARVTLAEDRPGRARVSGRVEDPVGGFSTAVIVVRLAA